jgi:hypothetical protein
VEQLDEVMTNLHDCPFDLDRAIFDAVPHLDRLLPSSALGRPSRRTPGLLDILRSEPVACDRSSSHGFGVNNCVVADKAQIGRYSFNEIEPTANGLLLHFNENLDIDLELSHVIDANYEEHLVPELRAIYRQVLLVQSGPKIETGGA